MRMYANTGMVDGEILNSIIKIAIFNCLLRGYYFLEGVLDAKCQSIENPSPPGRGWVLKYPQRQYCNIINRLTLYADV
jgi:hypothetical protein